MDHFFDPNGAIALGTTIMAATFKGGVVLGADSRTSNGNYVANRVTDKITKLTDNIYILRSGSAADTQNITAYLRWFLAQHQIETNDEPEVATAANMAMQMLYQNKNLLQAGVIVAGWDRHLGAQVYALPLGGTLTRTNFSIGGSGSAYIYGFCDDVWKDDMTEEECRQFVQQAVALAMGRDGSSGGCIRMAIVTEEGVKREFIPNPEVPLFEMATGDIVPSKGTAA